MGDDSRLIKVIQIFLTMSESEIVEILSASGLEDYYRGPAPGLSREQRIRTILDRPAACERLDEILARIQANADRSDQSENLSGSKPLEQRDDSSKVIPALVFVVHGRNHRWWNEVGWLIDRVGNGALRALILEQESNKGQTIIEKFEEFAQKVVFAVAIMTGDDFGGVDEARETRVRARQNAVFEVGYFFAKLGRNKVVLLVEPDIERLTQLDGVLHIELDEAGAWKSSLVREMRAAGLAADSNRIS